MKLYFAKYITIEGEIKKRTGTTVSNEVGKCLRENDDGFDYYQKVKLFLCTGEIQVGDKVWSNFDGGLLAKGKYLRKEEWYMYFENWHGEEIMLHEKECEGWFLHSFYQAKYDLQKSLEKEILTRKSMEI